jgi:hypothetical protein
MTITAEEYKASLPKTQNKRGVLWTIDTFSTYVNMLYPHITVKGGQEWNGSYNVKYTFVCEEHGEYEAYASHVLCPKKGCQCRKCRDENCNKSAGKKRCPRATKEEKQLAAKLYAELGNYNEVARRMNRSKNAIMKWLNPDFAKRHAEYNRNRYKDPAIKERHKLTGKFYTSETEHGKAPVVVPLCGTLLTLS